LASSAASTVSSAVDKAKGYINQTDTGRNILDKAGDIKDSIADKAQPVIDKVKDVGSNIINKPDETLSSAKDTAAQAVDKGKDYLI